MDSVPDRGQPIPAQAERRRTALGETTVQLVLAAMVTVGAGLWAWSLAASAFAGPPMLAPPGIIGVAVETSPGTENEPIDVTADYHPATDGTAANVDLSFTQTLPATDSERPSPTVIVFLCGPVAQHPDFINGHSVAVRWRVPSAPNHEKAWNSTFGDYGQCVDTTLAMNDLGSTGELRQALIGGSFDVAASRSNGTKTLYNMPGIAEWVTAIPLVDLQPVPVPAGSTVTVRLYKDAGGLTNVFASPQLPDSGTLTWTSKVDGSTPPVREYRLEADSQTAVSQLQAHLFLAGALVGVSGGAFVWLVQLCGQTLCGAAAERAKRTKPEVHEKKPSQPADNEVPDPATPQPIQREGTGLGWPG